MADQFFWYDLMTSDVAGAKAFYSAVVGWKMSAFGDAHDYTVLGVGEGRGIGGIMAIPEDGKAGGMKPCWVGYIHVTDIDAKLDDLKAAGGTVLMAAQPIPDVGRFAVVADPQGARFNLLQPEGPDMPPLARGTVGKVDWHELHSTDWESGFAFYSALFGWSKTVAMDMGPMGTYQLFATGGSGDDGGLMNEPPGGAPAPYWLFYVSVDAIDAAVDRINGHGGAVMMGPHEVPGGAWTVVARDPQGAVFALVAPKR